MRVIRRTSRALGCALLAALLATACDSDGGGGGDGGGNPTSPGGGELRVSESSGSDQAGEVATMLPAPLALRVLDASDRPGAGLPVSWAVTGGDGQVSSASSTTDAEGRASVQWVLGRVAGPQSVTATISGLPAVTYTARAIPGRTASVTLTPTPLVVTRGGNVELRVIARDGFGNVITGRAVTVRSENPAVAAVNAGAGADSVSAMAMVSGAGGGTTVISAESEGVTGSTVVSVTEDAQPVLVVASGNGQTGTAGRPAAQPLVARLALPGGAAVAGRTVRFAVISGGGSVETSQAVTDADGNASTRFTFGPRAGIHAVSATVDGLAPVSFTLTATAGAAVSVSVTPATLSLQTGGAQQLTVAATDAGGNPVEADPLFSSANPAVATVTAQGVVRGVAAGSTTVTVRVDGATTNVPVTVSGGAAPTVATVTITPSPLGLRVGESVQVSVAARDAAGTLIPGLPATLTTSNPGVAAVSADGTVTGVAAGTAEVSATVGGITARVTVTVSSAAAVGSVTITPNPVLVTVGGSVPLTVVARDPSGTVVPGLTATLTSSNPAVASVSAQGVVTGVAPGSATVTATVNGVSTSVLVQVRAIATVAISPSPVSLRVGATVPLTITARDASGTAIPGLSATLVSSNANVARVNADGSITGVTPGSATVTATVAGVSATVNVTVTAGVSTVTISPSPVSLRVGATVPLAVTARDAGGAPLLGLSATLVSSNANIVRVNANGSLTGVAAGTATVTATVDGVSATVNVTVTAAVSTVTISPSPVSLRVGATVPLTITARDASGTAIPGLSATLVSSNANIVRVNANGSLTGVAAGTATVTATVDGVSATVNVTVTAAVSTVTISPSPVSLRVGATVPLTITARDASGTAIPGLSATLVSSNANIVRVNANGSLTGVAAGTATVTATVDGVSATVNVTVTAAVSTVTISPSPVSLRVGATVPLTITARDASGTAIPGLSATLVSSNANIVRVNANGSLTGVAAGTATVTATVDGVSATVNVTVTAAVSTVTISPSPVSLRVGATVPLTITARDASGTAIPGLSATLVSSNANIVRVNANGSLTGVAAGTATVTATVDGVSATVNVTVTAAVSTVTISPSPVSLRVGATVPLTITARDASGTVIPGLSATLVSSNANVVRVNANGSLTGVAAGTATVTATVDGVSATVNVTVRASATTVTISPSPVSLRVGATVPLTITARDASGTAIPGLSATLVSSNANVVRVNANGSLTGVAAGTATVTATVDGVSATVNVTVTAAVSTVTISPSPVSLRVGATVPLTITARDASGTAIPGLSATLVSSNANVVRVNANGSLTGVAAGTATVTATVDGVSATVNVTVTPAVATVAISPSPVSVRVGATAQLTVTARDAGGVTIPGLTPTFTSSNPAVATVSASGTVTGVAAGTATVTATVLGVSAQVTVTVTAPLVSIRITPSPINIGVGVTLPITVTPLDGNGLPILGLLVNLTSSNPNVVRVNANGTITGLVAGTATLTATVLGISAQVTVTVASTPTVASVDVTPGQVSLRVGELLRLSIQARDAQGTIIPGITAALSSSNPLVAVVAPDGTITGLLPGTAEVTVVVGGVTRRIPVTVRLL